MKDKLGGKFMTKMCWIKAKSFSYIIHDCSQDKKAKRTKKYVKKKQLKFENYKNYLAATQYIYLGQNITLQQMLQRLLKPLAQVKGVNTSQNTLNETG